MNAPMKKTILPSSGLGKLIAAAYRVEPKIGPKAFPK